MANSLAIFKEVNSAQVDRKIRSLKTTIKEVKNCIYTIEHHLESFVDNLSDEEFKKIKQDCLHIAMMVGHIKQLTSDE